MKNLLQLIPISIAFLFISSCKKDTSAPAFTDLPIVQAFLSVDSAASVNISRLLPYGNNPTYSGDDINALNLTINANGTTYTLSPSGNGNYINTALQISDTVQYSLQFMYNGKTVTATTKPLTKPLGYTQSTSSISIAQVPLGESPNSIYYVNPLPSPVIYNWNNPDHSYYIVVVQNLETNPVLINLNDATEPTRVFRNQPTQDDNLQINARQFQYYGRHAIYLYHVLSDYANLYINNGTSSQNLANPETNITNGLGIFTAISASVQYLTVVKL